MIAFRHILCPVDFSEFSRHAVDHAVAIAHWYGGTVTALHVMHPIPYTDPLMASAIVFTPEDIERPPGSPAVRQAERARTRSTQPWSKERGLHHHR
jgi:nucleotide-binding universal stress UspA family protein